MGRPRKTEEEPVKKTRAKKVEEPEVKTEQIEDPVLEEETEEIIPEPVEEPAAVPEIKPIEYIVKVREDSWLNVRRGPGRNFEAIAKLKNGESVFVYELKDGFARIGDDVWVDTKFLISRL